MGRLDLDNPHGFRAGERVLDGADEPCIILAMHKATAFVLFNPDDRETSYATDWPLRQLSPLPTPANDTHEPTPPTDPVGAKLEAAA